MDTSKTVSIVTGILDRTATPAKGKFLYYYAFGIGLPGIALVDWETNEPTFLQNFAYNSDHSVLFAIRGIDLKIYFDDAQLGETINLASYANDEKAFWIGYKIQATGSIRANISDISITEK